MKVFQIYFHERHRPLLEAEYLPIYNYAPTKYFESQVIADLIEAGQHKGSDYFGVVSYKLREKIGIMKNNWRDHPNIANHSTQEFTPEEFKRQLYDKMPDAMSFQCHQGHDIVLKAQEFHPKFMQLWTYIMNRIGFPWKPTIIANVFYCNFFIAKSEIYEAYVKEMLLPAMDLMDRMTTSSGIWDDSGYRNTQLPPEVQKRLGVKYWPYHPFLCERMFSWYAHLNGLKCLHY